MPCVGRLYKMAGKKIGSGNDVESWFSRENYSAAFGYYEGIGPEEPPWNQALLGRETQRARLLNLLFNVGGKGAYLVTGHRGSGKTTFVDYCLEEYRRNVFERFLQRNVGRAFLWDRLGLLFICTLFMTLMMLVHDSLGYMIEATLEGRVLGLLGWPLIILLALITLHPFVLAIGRMQLICDRVLDITTPVDSDKANGLLWLVGKGKPNAHPFLMIFAIASLLLLYPVLGNPKSAILHAILFCSCMFWSCNYIGILESIWGLKQETRNAQETSRDGDDVQVKPWALPAAGLTIFTYSIVYGFLRTPAALWFSGFLIGSGLLLRAAQSWSTISHFRSPEQDEKKLRQSVRATEQSALWLFIPSVCLILLSLLQLYGKWIELGPLAPTRGIYLLAIVALSFLLSIILIGYHWNASKNLKSAVGGDPRQMQSQFAQIYQVAAGARRYPLLLLLTKALALTLTGIYLSFPILKLLTEKLGPHLVHLLELVNRLTANIIHLQLPNNSLADQLVTGSYPWVLFHEPVETLSWLAGIISIFCFISFLEYEWIIRPYQAERRDPAMQVNPEAIRKSLKSSSSRQSYFAEYRNRNYYQKLAEQTLFWRIYQDWQPLLVIPVNLGFDTLDHHRVVEAMLTGLRDAYERTFFRWSSSVFACIRILTFLLVFSATAQTAWLWFSLDRGELDSLEQGVFCQKHVSSSFTVTHTRSTFGENPEARIKSSILDPDIAPVGSEVEQESPPLMRVACHLGSEPLAQILQWPILPAPIPTDTNLGRTCLICDPNHPSCYSLLGRLMPEINHAPGGFTLRFYHLLMFTFFWFLGSWYLRRNPILPFTRTLASLDNLLSSLSSRMREESRDSQSPFQRVLGVFTGEQKVRYREADPFDPRSVELATIGVLRNIQRPAIEPPFFSRHRVNLPIPEVVFKFDELDKLGLGVIPPHDVTGPEVEHGDAIRRERQRAESLRNLFSDLKNVVSSGVARFIFVGGRNLHDEWLADQTARRPLLTNIFEAELYLPSLIVDRSSESAGGKLWKGVQEYVGYQRIRAQALNQKSLQLRYRPWLTPWVEDRRPPAFGLTALAVEKGEDLEGLPLGDGFRRIGKPVNVPPEWSPSFQRDFIHFLTYRSHGHVKKLRTLLEDFIRPVGSAIAVDECRNMMYDSQHVLYFQDIDRFRIQLIADIYRHIAATFDPRMAYRDDKLVVSTLYLADFVLKFHRRAFTWNSLQKVDELAHIHRAPDLPQAVNDLVFDWMEPFLHTIRNGMYDYRFNSDFARELEYLSRRSEEELAAFNFTLDESQALKAIYRSRIKAVKEPESFETIASLGELHDFDQEYEVARYYYIQAIDLLDKHLHSQVRKPDSVPAVFLVLSDRKEGYAAARHRLTWGITRLRLKLLTGMTFERPRELEQAQAHYRNARTLAAVLIGALISVHRVETGSFTELFPNPDEGHPDYVSTLKHLFILFQPAFAEAWVSEKVVGGIDTSVRLLERRLWELRWRLPFVNELFRRRFHSHRMISQHPSFALMMAEQHNRAGDLLFFKGKQLVISRGIAELPTQEQVGAGYLHRALYHYALSRHDIRSFNRFRREKLREFFSHHPAERGQSSSSSTERMAWGDFVYRACAGSIEDLSETMLAHVSLVGILLSGELAPKPPKQEKSIRDALERSFQEICRWLEGSDGEGWAGASDELFPSLRGRNQQWHALDRCLGTSRRMSGKPEDLADKPQKDLLDFPAANEMGRDPHQAAQYALFCLNAGRMLEEAGYHEDAARKHLRVVETISNYFWWSSIFLTVGKDLKPDTSEAVRSRLPPTLWEAVQTLADRPAKLLEVRGYLRDVLELGVEALERASALFLRSRVHIEARPVDKNTSPHRGLVGSQIPVTVPNLTCSLGLSILSLLSKVAPLCMKWTFPGFLRPTLSKFSTLFEQWTGKSLDLSSAAACREDLRERLRELLEAYSYPLIHRLNGLKVLHDDKVLHLFEASKAELKEGIGSAAEHLEELVELSDLYESPLHFTPLQGGLSLSLFYLLQKRLLREEGQEEIDWSPLIQWKRGWQHPEQIGLFAREELQQSREMYTMGRMYYHAISDLYYLYDDFNDRRIHYNHAIQMAASDLNVLLDAILAIHLDE